MLISMTGFGEARGPAGGMAISVEVRTINSRHYKLSFRSSEGYASLESDVETLTRESIRRGTVQLNLRVDRRSSVDDYRINTEVVENYRRQLQQFTGSEWNNADDLRLLLSLPGTIDEKSRGEYDPREDWPAIEPVIRDALAALAKMRAEEGVALAADLAHNGRQISELLDAIARRSPEVTQSYQSRLTGRVQQALSELNVTVEPADLLREIALFADRSDISEEIVRLRSHLQQYEAALLMAESSGRKLEFIAQEMGREINTIGSKANDAEISRLVVDIKTALERIREQIQNVE
ncbi:MAG: YicC/YloC family endoribonuclease [Pirellulales bacterium]